MSTSSAPHMKRSARRRTALAVVVGATGVLGGAAWLGPPWAATRCRDFIVEKLQARTDLPVRLGQVSWDQGAVTISSVHLGEAQGPAVELEDIRVGIDLGALWEGQLSVTYVDAMRGRVQGTRGGLVNLAQRLRGSESSAQRETSGASSRLHIKPTYARLKQLSFDVSETDPDARLQSVRGRARIGVDLEQGTLILDASNVEIAVHSRRATVQTLSCVLRRDPEQEGWQPVFPVPIAVEGLAVQATREIAVAGVDGRVEVLDRHAGALAVALTGSFAHELAEVAEQPRLWTLSGRFARDLSWGRIDASADDFELGQIPSILASLPLIESERGHVGGQVRMVLASGLVRVEGDVEVDGINIVHPVLAREPVRDVGFALQFSAEVDPERIRIERAVLERKGVTVEASATLEHFATPDLRRYDISVSSPETACQTVLASIPAGLVPGLEGFKLEGNFGFDVHLVADYEHLDDMVLDGRVGIAGCRVREAPAAVSATHLSEPFVHRVTLRDGSERAVDLYSTSGMFTPLQGISPYMVQAVLTTEDGGFFHHHGFLPSQFRVALQRNLAAGKVELGASTITMQMVKNVLLSHERTLARKLQEMFLTWYVEKYLTKERILELYLNVVELGPGIYGVTRGAQHYFGKWPGELTPPEAAYLALMLPSPVRRHSHYCRGVLSPSMEVKLRRILGLMHERHRLSDIDYELWKDAPLIFDPAERGSEGTCLAEIERLLSGRHRQYALTGVLAETEAPWIPKRDAADASGVQVAPADLSEPDAPGIPAMDDGQGRAH